MASNAASRTCSAMQSRTRGGEVLEHDDHRPLSLQIPKAPKSESNTPRRTRKHEFQSSAKHGATRSLDKDKLNQNIEGHILEKTPIQEEIPIELLRLNGAMSSEATLDQEKKSSEPGSGKDSSVSAKVSDGTGSLAKTSGSAKLSDRADFAESGKSSMRVSSSSDESTCSSFSSNISKPHKANDSRWEAIQVVRARDGALGLSHFKLLRDGALGLSHFKLLKRLGCGDIGSAYMSELSGTKPYFAMKVMDKASLAGRKKLPRVQTEREILQCLDHPFLPTLYTHFETDKFSCLVMEFCPGGDLHSLRQRQPGKYFSEQAVKIIM